MYFTNQLNFSFIKFLNEKVKKEKQMTLFSVESNGGLLYGHVESSFALSSLVAVLKTIFKVRGFKNLKTYNSVYPLYVLLNKNYVDMELKNATTVC